MVLVRLESAVDGAVSCGIFRIVDGNRFGVQTRSGLRRPFAYDGPAIRRHDHSSHWGSRRQPTGNILR